VSSKNNWSAKNKSPLENAFSNISQLFGDTLYIAILPLAHLMGTRKFATWGSRCTTRKVIIDIVPRHMAGTWSSRAIFFFVLGISFIDQHSIFPGLAHWWRYLPLFLSILHISLLQELVRLTCYSFLRLDEKLNKNVLRDCLAEILWWMGRQVYAQSG